MRLPLACLLFSLPFSAANAADAADLDAAFRAADNLALATYVEAHYRDAGISLDERLTWSFEPYDIIVNYFDVSEQRIYLGSMPADDEVEAYWLNWSKALTGSMWQPGQFFVDDAEARDLARYNQFVLAAHEYGHALTYRYDPEHFERHDREVNCREFYADRLATSLVAEVSAADPAFARLQSRYVALMASLNGSIAETDRYAIASLEGLSGNCASVHVEQPDANSMAPYASAYFERQRLLFSADPVPLAKLYDAYLLPPHSQRLPPASPLAGGVETVSALADLTEAAPPEEGYTRFALLAPVGIMLLDAPGSADSPGDLTYGPANGALAVIPRELWSEPGGLIMGAASYGADRLILMSLAQVDDRGRLTLIDLRRSGEHWTATRSTPTDDDIFIPVLAVDPTGRPHLFSFAFDGASPFLYVHTPLDAETLAAGLSVPLDVSGLPLAAGGAGEIYSFDNGTIFVTGVDGTTLRYAGNLLPGFEDNADARLAEFTQVNAMLPTGDGGMILIDTHPTTGQPMVRGVSPAGQ
jgi:hypothetical protein